MNRLRLPALAVLLIALLSLTLGWVLAGALRPTSAAPVAPIEMPSGGMVIEAPTEQSRGAEPVGPAPPFAGSITAPAGYRADDRDDDGDQGPDDERDEDLEDDPPDDDDDG